MQSFKPGPNFPMMGNGGDKLGGGLTIVIGLIAAFFLTGPAYNASVEDIAVYSIENYGEWSGGLARFLWFILCGSGVFFFARVIGFHLYKWIGLYIARLQGGGFGKQF